MDVNPKYLPILKWKQGERIALTKLSDDQRDGMVPVLELPAIDAAPDVASLRSALPAYIHKIGGELQKTFPEDQSFAVDTRYVADAYPKQLSLLNVVATGLQKQLQRDVIPVVNEAMLAGPPADTPPLSGFSAFIFRVRMNAIAPEQLVPLTEVARTKVFRRVVPWLIVDQYSIVGSDDARQAQEVRPYLDEAIRAKCAQVIVAGGSFPMNLVGYKQGVFNIPRVEWNVWKRLRVRPEYGALKYSDYSVTNPAPLPAIDPTQMNPSVAIRYAADGYWRLFKAGGFKKGAPNQYQALCRLLCYEPVYSGPSFSYGDQCYDLAREGKLGNGNPSSWRRDATSHHLVLTASML
jgi:hypothetical protein